MLVDTDTATLIQCTKSKRAEQAVAEDLYDESAYFRKLRAWADHRGEPWFILSGKHGLVRPTQILSPYNETGISKVQAREIATTLKENGVQNVHICAGSAYTDSLIPELESVDINVTNHFAGEGIGKRMQLLQQAVEAGESQ